MTTFWALSDWPAVSHDHMTVIYEMIAETWHLLFGFWQIPQTMGLLNGHKLMTMMICLTTTGKKGHKIRFYDNVLYDYK